MLNLFSDFNNQPVVGAFLGDLVGHGRHLVVEMGQDGALDAEHLPVFADVRAVHVEAHGLVVK